MSVLGLPAFVRRAARWIVLTTPGRLVLEQLAIADEETGRNLLERLAERYRAKLEFWE